MNVAVLTEARFIQAPDGSVWSEVGSNTVFTRYLDVFDEVSVVARLAHGSPRGQRVDAPGIRFADIPSYRGPLDYLVKRPRVRRAVRESIHATSAVICRLGSVLAEHLEKPFARTGRPYGVEVVGDPWEVFAHGVVVDHPARWLFRWRLTTLQKRLCAAACGAAYVTEFTLQRRYPTHGLQMAVSDVNIGVPALSTHYSSVELDQSYLVGLAKSPRSSGTFRIITVGSMEQPYKGIDVLIRAVSAISQPGPRCELVVVGDGRFRPSLEQLAVELRAPVVFLGNMTREEVTRELDGADLFAMASRTEGLPRALLEAMARGLPAVATRVGGIPEILDPEVLCPPNDVDAFVRVMSQLIADPSLAGKHATKNLARAADFRSDILHKRRLQFYEHVKHCTERWLAGNSRQGTDERSTQVETEARRQNLSTVDVVESR